MGNSSTNDTTVPWRPFFFPSADGGACEGLVYYAMSEGQMPHGCWHAGKKIHKCHSLYKTGMYDTCMMRRFDLLDGLINYRSINKIRVKETS